MNKLYILMILVVISLSGCNSHRNRLVSANKGSASIEQSDSSSVGDGETRKDSSEVERKAETDAQYENEQTKLVASVIYEYLFYLSAFINVCLIAIVYKKNNNIDELKDNIENNKWRVLKENDSKIWERNNFHTKSSTTKSEEKSSMNNHAEQETATKEEEPPVIIDLDLKNKYKYLIPAYQGKFPKMFDESSGKTRFRCWLEDNVWHFEFHGDLKKAIENYNATFDETCIVEGSYKGATRYKTETPGTLDENLKILTKSVIRLY